MKNIIEQRMMELQAEYQNGQARLNQLDQERARVVDTVLRISGAMQVLGELLQAQQEPAEGEGEHGSVH